MGIVTHNKTGAYTGYLANVALQTASAIGIAVKNNMPYAFHMGKYLPNFKGVFPAKTLGQLSEIAFTDITEKHFHYEDITLNPEGNYNLWGYFQSYKYFAHCEPLIRALFAFNSTIQRQAGDCLAEIKKSIPEQGAEIIAMHYRLGDYLAMKNVYTCLSDTEYYAQAIEQFDPARTVFLIFSDNVPQAMQHASVLATQTGRKFYYLQDSLSAAVEMAIMGLCDGCITANSTFSWLGAWLGNPHKTKQVLAPAKNRWFGPDYAGNWPGQELVVDDIIPEYWKQVDF